MYRWNLLLQPSNAFLNSVFMHTHVRHSSHRLGLLVLAVLFYAHSTTLRAQGERGPQSTQTKVERPVATPLQELKTDLDVILNDPNFRNAVIGAHVVSLQKNDVLYKSNESKSLVPASNMKLITTAAALEYLGPEFTYTTTVFLDGSLRRGEFSGNVFVRGAGDPSMSTYFLTNPMEIFERWADAFDSLGIRVIRGNIIGDDSYFDNTTWGPGWAWDDILYPFSSQVSALSFNDNKVDFQLLPGSEPGTPALVAMQPNNAYMTVINNVLTGQIGETSNIVPLREAYSNVVELTGFIEPDTTNTPAPVLQTVTVDNPTQFMMNLLKQTLESRGIRVLGGVFSIDEWDDRVNYTTLSPLCYYTSPPLGQIVRVINTTSHNLAAEMLLKTMAKEITGTGSFDKGCEVLRNFIAHYGIAQESVSIVDGSGLSRSNLLTPRQITTVLAAMYRSRYRTDFVNSLAVPGQIGTLATRMQDSRAEQNVQAKTGSMGHVCSLSGYVTSRDKEPLAFSLILNNFTVPQSLARNLQDLFVMRLASFQRKH